MNFLKNLLLIAAATLLISCSSGDKEAEVKTMQTISMLGDTLYTSETPLSPDLESRIDSMIMEAESDQDLVAIEIWKARHAGYQGTYNKAVEILSDAIEIYPADARLFRHRGHRYITLRQLDNAIEDLTRAAALTVGEDDMIETDGLPNAQDIPLSTLQTNIWYHLGLAYYLKGNYEKARDSYEEGLRISENDDMSVAFLYWYYMTLRRIGDDVRAGQVLDQVRPDMTIIENSSYYDLLRVFKGEFDEASLLDASDTALDNATVGYGLGFWHDINGRNSRASEIWNRVYESGPWASFGYIASEAELSGMN